MEEESAVCLSIKQIPPPMRTRAALTSIRDVVVADGLKLPTNPKLKISSSAPKIIPLIPASESKRFVASV